MKEGFGKMIDEQLIIDLSPELGKKKRSWQVEKASD